jgi:Lamin Tail Domain/Secretion system C-terminal sorting domain/Calx-beta domain
MEHTGRSPRRGRIVSGMAALAIAAMTTAQTNPAPQALPYTQDFSSLAHTGTAYPAGWQGWTISTLPTAAYNTAGPIADRVLIASSGASTNSGNVHNYNGKIGYLNSGSLDLTLCLALSTTGSASVQVVYDVMTIRNPYDGATNTRINELSLQYRVGNTGAWTTIAGQEYTNNTTLQTGTGVTTPQNLQTKTVTLPSACDNQAEVQVRWASRQVSGGGSRPSFSVDNVNVTGSALGNTTVAFATASSTVSEGVVTTNLTVNISDFSTTQATSVDVAITAGSAARVNNYTTQTVTFPANDGTPQNLTITVTDDAVYDGGGTVTFTLQNITGGQGTPAIGAPSSHALTISENEPSPLLINEVDYDNEYPSAPDSLEFVEIVNTGLAAIDLAGYKIELVNGAGGAVYSTITLPSFLLAPGGYYVVGNDATIPNINLVTGATTNFIQNGSPDAVGLRDPANNLLDAVSYEGNTLAPYTEGTGLVLADDATPGIGISRFPDGTDSNDNSVDWSRRCLSPGASNNSTFENCICTPVEATAISQCVDDFTWEIEVTVTSTGSGAAVDITNDGGAPSLLGVTAGVHTIGPFNNNTVVNVLVSHDAFDLCDVSLPGFFMNCLPDCNNIPGGPDVPGQPCDDLDAGTVNDVWSPACVCAGVPIQPVVGFVLPTSTAGEADVAMTVGLEMDIAPSAPVVVDVTDLLTGTATSAADYGAFGTLQFTFLPTDIYPNLQTFNVLLTDDTDYESIETFNLSLSINSGTALTSTSTFVGVITSDDLPSLRINEVDYDNAGADNAEWIELKNTGNAAMDLNGFIVQLVNGNTGGAAVYKTITLPAFSLAAGGYYVIGNNASIPNLNLLQTPATDMIQNGAPDAVGLRAPDNTLIDAISYEGNTGAPYTETVGMAITDFDDNVLAAKVIARYLDGNDTNDNSVDWKVWCATPGASNATVDADGDVIPDCLDNCPALFGVQGDACDDNNACTINDLITNACVCAGTFQDTDLDGICDANDNCPALPGQQGDPCDDSDACTINDQISNTCVCVGTFQDTDGDGTCDANDPCPTLANLVNGDPCDDSDACTINDIVTACICAGTFQDTDLDGICDVNDNCPTVSGTIGSPCDDGNNGTANDVLDALCVCAGTPVGCTGYEVELRIQLTGVGGDGITWEVRDEFQIVVASGGDYPSQPNSLIIENLCLPSVPFSCYTFTIYDAFGDGITGGYWELRDDNGSVILGDDGEFTAQSPDLASVIGTTGHAFCLPLGPSAPAPANCGVFTHALSSKVFAGVVPGALFYQFEFTDPNAGFIRRIMVPRNWVKFSEMQTVPLVPGTVYLCRVRVDQGASGVSDDKFGRACELGLDPNANNPCPQLINDPDLPTHSCGVTKTFGGSSKVWARPVVGANQYRFRFTNSGMGYNRIVAQNSYVCPLTWTTQPLVPGTYDVAVESRVNNVWSGFCGNTCSLTIVSAPEAFEQSDADVIDGTPALTLWPNPNTDGQVRLYVNGLSNTTHQVSIELFDLLGAKVRGEQMNSDGDVLNTTIDLDADMPRGVYLVSITIDQRVFTQRLVVQ